MGYKTRHKWLRFFILGGVGGISPTLLKFAFHPFTYFGEFTSSIHWYCWIAAIIIFFGIGGTVAFVAEKKSIAKAFYLGVSAPSIIFAVYHTTAIEEYQIKHEFKQMEVSINTSCLAFADADTTIPRKTLKEKGNVPTSETIHVKNGEPIEIIVPPALIVHYYPEGTIHFKIALAEHSMGDYKVPVRIIMKNDSTILSQEDVPLYRKQHRYTIIDSHVDLFLRKVKSGDYNFITEIEVGNTLLTDSIEINVTETDQIQIVGIVDMTDKKLFLHHAKNLTGEELISWAEMLQKQHGKQPAFLKRILKTIFKVFF